MLREILLFAGNIGAWSIFLAILKGYWDHHRFRQFRNTLRKIGQEQEVILPTDLHEEEWQALVAIYLQDAKFSASEIEKMMKVAVLVAKAEVAQALRKVREQFDEREREENKGRT